MSVYWRKKLVYRPEHEFQEEYERRLEAERDQDVMNEEVTRLNEEVLRLTALFQDVSLLTQDALQGN